MLKHVITLPGHQNPVYALTTTDDPGIFLTAGNDKGIVEWSLDLKAFIKVIMPVQSSVYSMVFSGGLLFSGERSGVFNVFDVQQQVLLQSFPAHTKPVFDIKVVPEKNEFLTSSEDGTVAIWSLKDYSLLYRIDIASETVRVMSISKNLKELAVGTKAGIICIYDLEDYALLSQFQAHDLPVTSLQYSPDGQYLLSGGRDAQLKAWSLPIYTQSQHVPAHLYSIYSIVYHPILPYFATGSQDKSIKIWGSENYKLYKILSLEKGTEGHTHSVNKLAWSADGRYLISTGDDKLVMIWEMI
ncbi:MAG: WD40 repeat domain-containing protein [Pedobacter sp.]|nr:MAG: WD40 repeat domain-containing protein [Pedobacter sp.]